MLHRSVLLAPAIVCGLWSAGCDSPTDPSRPGYFDVVFLGAPQDAETFTPTALASGRVVGTASDGDRAWAVQWAGGAFSRVGPDVPANCGTEALGARLAFTVGRVTCLDAAGNPADAYGWAAGVATPPRLFGEPYEFVGVNASGVIVGTIYPPPGPASGGQRAFIVQGGAATILLPPGAVRSEAVGISDEGMVAVTAYYECGEDRDCARTRAVVLREGEWRELPLPGTADRSFAAAASSDGRVTGYTYGEADGIFLYRSRRDRFRPLPVVPGSNVLIGDVNALGQVVGTGFRLFPAEGQEPAYGIVWGGGLQYSLSERLRNNAPWLVTGAHATDDEGRIAGTGFNRETAQQGAILLVPEP